MFHGGSAAARCTLRRKSSACGPEMLANDILRNVKYTCYKLSAVCHCPAFCTQI